MLFSDSTVHLRKEKGLQAATQLVSANNGRLLTDHVRLIIKENEDEERGLLEQWKSEAEKALAHLLAIGRTVMIVGIALLIILFSKERLYAAAEQRANELLRNNEDLFRSMASKIKEYGIFLPDPKGIDTTLNDGAKNIEGYLGAEITGKSFELFYDREDIANGRHAHNLEMAGTLEAQLKLVMMNEGQLNGVKNFG
jgi:hypothetical protein